ncbi:HDR092Cp [Eremothecium sinecaudum]|uniref:Peptide-N(4)-(N-acetyl-beta-glucosaminyl)asparagine amidase n=1 Tax=Eremothecium sinecaudum TaxID=45286 RepID=A0A0X8HSU3_9SACH|nr:HDR092Cp [Eremothecium sinecaudum]AMD20834.1 HDR092Cp [Eremothecium sinecaudum]
MSTNNMYADISKRILESYKKLVLDRDRRFQDNDELRYQTLLKRNDFAREIHSLYETLCFRYDNDYLQSRVLDTFDLDLIYANVDAKNVADDEYQDALVNELLRYFKEDFFSWCNSPICVRCQTAEHQSNIQPDSPNAAEMPFQCTVVERYICGHCNGVTRFPRYNDSLKLLQTRTGRCGEWCNLFTLVLKSFGVEARYIWNKEDHVWCEIYSSRLKRWVHVDSCEKSFDQPYIYSNNWNKSMSYVIAFSNDTVVDVSKRYILKNQLPRDLINEDDLEFMTKYLTKKLRKQLHDDELYKLACRDGVELLELRTNTNQPTHTSSAPIGRVSGSTEWKKNRGEDGL